MATAKTTKAKKAPAKKVTAKAATTVKSSTSASMSLGDAITRNKKNLIIGGAVIVIAAIAFLLRGQFISAIVNGQPISRASIVRELEKQSGQAALDKAITKALVFQEASKKNVSVTQADINKEIEKLTKQFKDQGQDLNQLLVSQGIKKSDFQEDIKLQIAVQKILGSQVTVSDKEFEDFLAKNPTLLTSEKDQETAKKNLRIQLQQQKLSQKYQEWIATIKKNAKIQQFVEYTNL